MTYVQRSFWPGWPASGPRRLLVPLLTLAIVVSGFAGRAGAAQSIPPAPDASTALERLLFGEQGVYGVLLMDPDGTVLYSRNADTPFIAASLYKLIVMVDLFAARERGALDFESSLDLLPEYFPGDGEPADSYYDASMAGGTATISDLMYAMISYSSNVAAHALMTLTSPERLNSVAQQLGMPNTSIMVPVEQLPNWPPKVDDQTNPLSMDLAVRFVAAESQAGAVNLTTPRDIAHFFNLLYHQQIISASVSREMVDLLREQAVDDKFPFLLPPGTNCPHKTGNLDHVTHDAGIIYGQNGPVITVAMSEATPDDARATYIIQRVALIAYGDLDPPPIPDEPTATPEIPTPIDGTIDGEAPTPPDGSVDPNADGSGVGPGQGDVGTGDVTPTDASG